MAIPFLSPIDRLNLWCVRSRRSPHIARIRFHTRFPIGIPERIDQGLLDMLRDLRQAVWFVIHSNHPRELDDDVLASLALLRRQGIILQNQAVLLRGVNDDVDTLKGLFERLVNHRIAPYYLHQLDRVTGTAHFEVSERRGKQLITDPNKLLPGYAIPRFVKEVPGAPVKTLLK